MKHSRSGGIIHENKCSQSIHKIVLKKRQLCFLQLCPVLGDSTINYIVLGLAIVFEGGAWFLVFKKFSKVKGSRGYFQAVREGKDPPPFVVLFEDSAAMLGLMFALTGVALGDITGDPAYAAAASIAIGLLLAATVIWFAQETKGLLISESVRKTVVDDIKRIVSKSDYLEHVNEVLAVHMCPDYIRVNISIEFDSHASADDTEKSVDFLDKE